MARKLQQYDLYTRQDVHDIFDPLSTFKPQTDTWGLRGIVPIPDCPGDYVFFVEIGKKVVGHSFNEEVFDDGSFTWQAQPSNGFNHKYIKEFIRHDADINNIYLFLRTAPGERYAYLGLLEYVTHDTTREKPVYFMWHIIDFDEDKVCAALPKLVIKSRSSASAAIAPSTAVATGTSTVIHTSPIVGKITYDSTPASRKKPSGVGSASFGARNVDFQGEAKKNSRIGNDGEDAVVNYEKDRLIAAGRADLAAKVIATRDSIGNTAKFDVMSFEYSGAIRFIEVKTTTGSKNSLFHISEREVKFSEDHPTDYFLYRIYNWDKTSKTGSFYIEKGPIDRSKLIATNYIL